jgi:hypothetical protein
MAVVRILMLPPTRVTQTEVLPTGMLIIISNECCCVSVVVGGDDDDDDGDDRDSSL